MKFPQVRLPQLNLSHMTMARRLSLAFGLVLALFAGTTAFAVYKMKMLEADMKSSQHAALVVSSQARAMRDAINEAFTNSLLLTMARVKDDLDFQAKELKGSLEKYRKAKKDLIAMTNSGEGIKGFKEAIDLATETEPAMITMESTINRRMRAAEGASADAEIELDLSAQGDAAFNNRGQLNFWANATTKLVDLIIKEAEKKAAEAQEAAVLARSVLLVAATIALFVSLGAAVLIARSVTKPIRQAVMVAEQVAKGDLSQDIHAESKDETGALLEALSRMQDSLHGLVGEVRESAHSIELASAEVAMGNSDLSQRTEQTAGNLQRTSSSMEQLTGSVRQSAESAQAANQLVNTAAVAAERGGEVVSQVVNNMQSIAAQSKKIADIIGVIDGIAFQTNILALNAAVEAARAGEQGRGFAVVAGEVRNLAQRSAAAAKDIKSLIGASVEQVESGSKLVQDAGRSMEDIVTSVRKVTDMIGEISASAAVQSEGIGEVGSAMMQLDQMTQQNAALVEQSAAAAESLKSQAQRLSEVVSAFTLRRHGGLARQIPQALEA